MTQIRNKLPSNAFYHRSRFSFSPAIARGFLFALDANGKGKSPS